jgi:hypothetical protein
MPQTLKAGMVSYNGLVNLFGITGSAGTSEVETGLMTVSNSNNWLGRLNDSSFSTSGPTGAWATEWFSVWNYLQYGGSCVIGGTGSTGAYYSSNGTLNTTNTILHNKNLVQLDLVFEGGNTFSSAAAVSVVNTRQDCVAVIGNYKDIATLNMNSAYDGFTTDFGAKNISKYVIYTAGRKKFTYVNAGIASVYEIQLSPDVAGCFARTAQSDNIWISPAGMTRGRILNVLYLTQKFTDSDINYFGAGGVNAINSIPGEGTFLLSNITSYPYTATTTASSKINTMMTTLYIKKQMINLLKGFLYQPNNASLRQQVINSATPIMETLKGTNGVSDYRIVCDETNNTDASVALGKLVLDIYCTFIYPAVSIILRILASDTGEVVDTQTV